MWSLIFYIEKYYGSAACQIFRIVEFGLRNAECHGISPSDWGGSVERPLRTTRSPAT
jgi:hypothetical protein